MDLSANVASTRVEFNSGKGSDSKMEAGGREAGLMSTGLMLSGAAFM